MVAANQSSESKDSLCGERLSLDSDGDLKGVEREARIKLAYHRNGRAVDV